MLPRERLVTLDLSCRVHMPHGRYGSLAKVSLNTIVHGEVYRPGREIAEYCRPQAAIEAADAVVLEDVLDGVWVGSEALNKTYG